jgi:hypothetical protein
VKRAAYFAHGVRTCEKIESVMLSAAKHLKYLVENKPMQILRFAQDDKAG